MTSPARGFVLTLPCRDKKDIVFAIFRLRFAAIERAELNEGTIEPLEHGILTHRHKTVVFK